MEISLTTPALLFPAISLLLLAFTNRFLAIAGLIRSLHGKYQEDRNKLLAAQIRNLRLRLVLIRTMQLCGICSLFLCVLCMFVLFYGLLVLGKIIFGISLIFMMGALAVSLWEIQISVQALNIQLSDMDAAKEEKK